MFTASMKPNTADRWCDYRLTATGLLRLSRRRPKRRAWLAGAARRWRPVGRAGRCAKLSDAQLDRLAAELDRGPAAQEWADWTSDQRWTLARVAALPGPWPGRPRSGRLSDMIDLPFGRRLCWSSRHFG